MKEVSSNENIPVPSCSIIVNNPHMAGIDVLTVMSELTQTITDLCVADLKVDEKTSGQIDQPVFKMDSNAKLLIINDTILPSCVTRNLLYQSVNYQELEAFCVSDIFDIGRFIHNFHVSKNLSHLKLSYCGLSEDESAVLCRQLSSVNQLQTLDLSYNSLGSGGAIIIADSIMKSGSLSQLVDLNLDKCSLCKPGSSTLLDALRKCARIQFLSLSWNPIGNEGGDCLSNTITSWGPDAELEILSSQECGLGMSGTFPLMKTVANCKCLTYFKLSDNNIDGLFSKLIKDSAWKLSSLEELRVAATGLGGEDIQALASLVEQNRLPSLGPHWESDTQTK